jgi:hypothetical protein
MRPGKGHILLLWAFLGKDGIRYSTIRKNPLFQVPFFWNGSPNLSYKDYPEIFEGVKFRF